MFRYVFEWFAIILLFGFIMIMCNTKLTEKDIYVITFVWAISRICLTFENRRNTMIKRVVKITGGVEWIVDTINDFIKNDLKESEYVVEIKYMKNGEQLKPCEKNRGIGFETIIAAIIHVGELK